MGKDQLDKAIQFARKNMDKSAMELDFVDAAKYRDELYSLEKLRSEKFGKIA